MPRRPRLVIPGATYHLTARGNRRQKIFADDHDRRLYLRILGDVTARCGWRCRAFCLLPNHVHLMVETPEPNLSSGMHRLQGRYAQWFNNRHGVVGHVFQDRFHSVVVESDGHLLELIRYVFLNPVRAGLCVVAEDWPWSSYRATLGSATCPPFLAIGELLGLFADEPGRARRHLANFVGQGPPAAPRPT